jgi:outer membrane protein, heavy metal efflux system
MSHRLLVILLGILLWVSRCIAAEGDTTSPDLAAAVDLPRIEACAMANNAEIRAMEQRWRAAQARPSQAGSLPDPMINTAYHNESFNRFQQGRSDMAWLRFGAEQELPFPGKLALKETIAAREADREGAVYRATVLNVLARLRMAYDDYFLAHKSIEIVRNSKDLLQELTQAAEARYQVGEGLQQDVARAQVELSILVGRLTSVEQERQSAAAMLNALLNRPPAAPLGAPTPLQKPVLADTLEQIEAVARENSPNLKAADIETARAESNLDLAKRAYYPDFILRADYFNKAGLVPEWELGAGIRVPLYFWRKQAFGVQEAAAGVNEARAAKQSTSQDVLAKINDLYAQAISADRLVELYGNAVVPQAEVSLNSASAGYQVGKVDFLTVLNSFTVLNEYRLRYYEELAKLDKAIAGIEEMTGLLHGDESDGASS